MAITKQQTWKLDDMAKSVRDLNRDILILRSEANPTQIHVLDQAQESLALFESNELHQIRRAFE